jgi:hypothetical protein
VVINISSSEKLFIGGDHNGHLNKIGTKFERIHEYFGYDDQNQEEE